MKEVNKISYLLCEIKNFKSTLFIEDVDLKIIDRNYEAYNIDLE